MCKPNTCPPSTIPARFCAATPKAPKDGTELRRSLMTAVYGGHPAAGRYPRGNGLGVALDETITALPIGKGELLREGDDLLLAAIGAMVAPALKLAEELAAEGIQCSVVNARFLKPMDSDLIATQAARVKGVVAIEEGCEPGGFCAAVLETLADADVVRPLLRCAVPDHIVHHGDPKRLMDDEGLSPAPQASRIRAFRKAPT